MKTSGAQNAALQLNTKLDGHYYYMNDQHLFCVRGTGISTSVSDHQLWFMAGQHVGVIPASRTFTTSLGETVVVWETADFIFKGNIVYLNLSGSFITCFGLTPASGQTVVISDISYYTDAEVQQIETGILTIHNAQFIMQNSVYDLQGRKVRQPSRRGVYMTKGKKIIIK